jgi:GTPase SAR1 family protein
MDPIRNPFVPGAGSPPPALAGRGEILEQARITLGRVAAGRASKSLMLVGLRGVGKTVLLNRIQELAEAERYQALLIETPENKRLASLLLPPLRSLLFRLDRQEAVNEHVKRAMRVLKSFAGAVSVKYGDFEVGLDIDPERGSADSGDIEADLADLFLAVAEAAKARQTAVALIIDELQYLTEDELSAVIMALHRVAQKQLPLVLIGAGLPQLVGLAGRSKSYAERLFEYPVVGALSRLDAVRALVEPVRDEGVSFTDAALDEIMRLTEGYPYFLQEWGYQSWNLAADSTIDLDVVDVATREALRRLDQSFFRVRLDRLTPREKVYLRAMAELGPGPHRSGDIAERMGAAVASVAPLRGGLIKKGMIYSPTHGDTAFTVPLFDQFMRRTIPAA